LRNGASVLPWVNDPLLVIILLIGLSYNNNKLHLEIHHNVVLTKELMSMLVVKSFSYSNYGLVYESINYRASSTFLYKVRSICFTLCYFCVRFILIIPLSCINTKKLEYT